MTTPLTAIIIMVLPLVRAMICILPNADNAGGNTRSDFNCNSYHSPYCDNYLWVGTRYGNHFRPDELEVYYEVSA